MSQDPKYTVVSLFDALGNTTLFEIEDTPLDTELKVTIDESGSLCTSVGTLLFIAACLLPESSTKWHAWKAYHSLLRERVSLDHRMTTDLKNSEDELPF